MRKGRTLTALDLCQSSCYSRYRSGISASIHQQYDACGLHTYRPHTDPLSSKVIVSHFFSHSIVFFFLPRPLAFTTTRCPFSSELPSFLQPFALLMDTVAAKDLGCLLGGYCKLLVDPSVNVFRLGRPKVRVHRVSAEEGVCGKFAVVEGVCYESLSSEQKLFHFN